MGIIKIVRRNIMFKPLQSLIACLVVAAGIAMAVAAGRRRAQRLKLCGGAFPHRGGH